MTPQTFVLQPGQVESVQVTVAPTFYSPGDHYLGVLFSTTATVTGTSPKTHKTVVVNTAIGAESEIIVEAPGVANVDTTSTLTASHWSFGGPVKLGLDMDNKGNVYYLNNNLKVTDGSNVVTQFPGALVLSGAHRTETAQWASAPAVGIVHLHLAGSNQTVTVIRVPLGEIIGGAVVLIGLMLMMVFSRKHSNKRVRRAVEHARKG